MCKNTRKQQPRTKSNGDQTNGEQEKKRNKGKNKILKCVCVCEFTVSKSFQKGQRQQYKPAESY